MELRDYQKVGAAFLVKQKRAILADYMGLGKTVQGAAALRQLYDAGLLPNERVLICGSRLAIIAWRREIKRWLPPEFQPTVIHGTPYGRKQLWENHGFVITTFDTFRIDHVKFKPRMLHWDLIIADEPHKRLRSRKTKNFAAFRTLRSVYLWFITGTPAGRKAPARDLWTMLYLINRKLFSSYWRWVATFCHRIEGFWGVDYEGIRNKEQLKVVLEPILLRRTKKDIGWREPQRDMIPVEMSPKVAKIYKQLTTELMATVIVPGEEDRHIIASTVMGKLMKLRQLLLAPKMFGIDEPSAGMVMIAEKLDEMEVPHAAIFTPFKIIFPYLEEYLRQQGHENIVFLKGGMSLKQIQEQIAIYEETKGLCICTTQFAESFDLDSSPEGFFHGFTYDFQEHEQAEARLDRGRNQDVMVNLYYPVHQNTLEEGDMLSLLNQKSRDVHELLRGLNGIKDA